MSSSWKIKKSLWEQIKEIMDNISQEISYLKVYSKSAFVRISYTGDIILFEGDFGIHSNPWNIERETENKIYSIIDSVCDRCSIQIGNSQGCSNISNKEDIKKKYTPFLELTVRNDYSELGYGYFKGDMTEDIFERINEEAFLLGKEMKDSGMQVKVRLTPTILN